MAIGRLRYNDSERAIMIVRGARVMADRASANRGEAPGTVEDIETDMDLTVFNGRCAFLRNHRFLFRNHRFLFPTFPHTAKEWKTFVRTNGMVRDLDPDLEDAPFLKNVEIVFSKGSLPFEQF